MISFVYDSSGLSIKYSNWDAAEPDNAYGEQNCAAIIGSDGNWFDKNCTDMSINIVCEDLQEDLPFWSPCQEGWDLIHKKCYRFIDQTLKFGTAASMCRALGGQMFEPTYELQEQKVREFYSKKYQQYAIWIGITDKTKEGR